MWLMDHQMNIRLSEAFGQYFVRLPLKKSPTIVCDNALRLDWKKVLSPAQCGYVLGNPPFVGKHLMTAEQGSDMASVWGETSGMGLLDYVTGWYRKAAEYIQGTRIVVGFVSTNSIAQGEQVGSLWMPLFQRFHLKIHFAHRTFAWESEARGKAHVHVVIVGFACFDTGNKRLYDFDADSKKVTVGSAANISPYLVEGSDMAIRSRMKPICRVPGIIYGSKPVDGGNLIIEDEDKKAFLIENPEARKYIRPFIGAEEFINGIPRWCLWLEDISASELRSIDGIKRRVEAVRAFRLASKKEPTKRKAEEPTLFAEIRQPSTSYLLIPSVSSETRKYVPIGFISKEVVANNAVMFVPEATHYQFGVLSSAMHMAWMRHVCGRLESRYRYSNKLVYNNYPWPESPSDARQKAVEEKARRVLELRVEFGDGRHGFLPTRKSGVAPATLADLYDPLSMPPKLVKAHAELDRAVDLCYRAQAFTSERQRVEFLFALYEKLTSPLLPATAKKQVPPRR